MRQEFNFNNELSGKIALVTGGTKGAGKAMHHSNYLITSKTYKNELT